MTIDVNKLVDSYVKLRDKKAKIKADADVEAAKVDALLSRVESVLLQHFMTTGTESVRTAAGTAYKSTTVKCSKADNVSWMGFLHETGAWDLADVRPSKANIKTYREAGNELPPGLNWLEEVTVGIRRS